jgi:hypothetical protein
MGRGGRQRPPAPLQVGIPLCAYQARLGPLWRPPRGVPGRAASAPTCTSGWGRAPRRGPPPIYRKWQSLGAHRTACVAAPAGIPAGAPGAGHHCSGYRALSPPSRRQRRTRLPAAGSLGAEAVTEQRPPTLVGGVWGPGSAPLGRDSRTSCARSGVSRSASVGFLSCGATSGRRAPIGQPALPSSSTLPPTRWGEGGQAPYPGVLRGGILRAGPKVGLG